MKMGLNRISLLLHRTQGTREGTKSILLMDEKTSFCTAAFVQGQCGSQA
jgi:hypothetical protein